MHVVLVCACVLRARDTPPGSSQAPFGHDSNDALANQLGIFKVIEQRCVCHPAHACASVSDAGSS